MIRGLTVIGGIRKVKRQYLEYNLYMHGLAKEQILSNAELKSSSNVSDTIIHMEP